MEAIYEKCRDVHVNQYEVYGKNGKLYYDSNFLNIVEPKIILDYCLYGDLIIFSDGIYYKVLSFNSEVLITFSNGKISEWKISDSPDILRVIFDDKNDSGYLYYKTEGSGSLRIRDDGFGNLEVNEDAQ